MTRALPLPLPLTLAFASIACGPTTAQPTTMTRDALLDPETCGTCHKDHFADWSASMHAYASEDPVFRAMNKRGQRETGGQLGDFCVNCHAPMAVREGATKDGQNLDSVPAKLHGVTCFFCHTVTSVAGTHNNPLELSSDITMRGEYADPVANPAHPAAYSRLHDLNYADSVPMCGACHDIVSPAGAKIERTFDDWRNSFFPHANGNTCTQCHMNAAPGLQPIAEAPGVSVFARKYHEHTFPSVDSALTAGFPPIPANRESLEDFLSLRTLQSALCVVQGGSNGVRVILDNFGAGHAVPSGSAQDRRLWVEVKAYDAAGNVLYESGVVPDGTAVTSLTADPDLWLVRDCMFDGPPDASGGPTGNPVSMFWQAASVDSNLVPFPVTIDPGDPRTYMTHVLERYPRDPASRIPATPAKVTMRVRLQPIGLDVLQDLVQSGDLDPSVVATMPTLDLLPVDPATMQAALTWTPTAAAALATSSMNATVYNEGPFRVSCVTAIPTLVQAQTVPAPTHVKCTP